VGILKFLDAVCLSIKLIPQLTNRKLFGGIVHKIAVSFIPQTLKYKFILLCC